MTCRQVIEFLLEYLSGGLLPDQRTTFEAHLQACPDCVAYLESYVQAVKMGKGAFDHPDDRGACEVPEELVLAILAARRKPL